MRSVDNIAVTNGKQEKKLGTDRIIHHIPNTVTRTHQ